ncbi:MAG: hypothetical protein RL071_3842 [Pseudomonadota bacterium]|jgi:enoyl-CoA hydratase/carnithine racemase
MAEAPFTPKAPPADAAAETGLVHVEVEAVRFGGQDVPVGVLRLGRPARANAYTPAMLRALEAGLRRLEGEARALVVEAEGAGAFCGGADLGLLAAARPEDALDLLSQRVFSAISTSPLPSVAAVQGPAVAGGCELALACDLRVAGPAARFALPETARGLVPAAGGCARLAALVGGAVARELILFGRPLSAERALQLGLIAELVDDPRAVARALAAAAGARDPLALRLAKDLLRPTDEAARLQAERHAEALLYARAAERR